MAARSMNEILKSRMSATRQASELETSDEAYLRIFQEEPASVKASIRELPLEQLVPFFTADIGFRPYSPEKLRAFAGQLQEEGLLVRIIVRPMGHADRYEILAGHNRVNAAKLAGWQTIPAEVVEADDVRAIVIATSTNLIQRQQLSIVERGKAYKALLGAKNRKGERFDLKPITSGENRPTYSARALVAEFFGVTEYEIRKLIKLSSMIPELLDVLEQNPKQLNLSCADLIADYDVDTQPAFVEMCSIEGYQLNKATVQHIVKVCPPPTADRQQIFAAWREARAIAEKRLSAPPKKISFDRKRFAPYLEKLESEAELEDLFLEFLRKKLSER